MMRYDIINGLIGRRKYSTFLEIGTFRGETFDRVVCEHKVSVDPDPASPATCHCTSDEYFSEPWCPKFDIVFIDGLHWAPQVWKDITNSLDHLNPGGTIVMHDCLPRTEKMQMPDMKSHQDEEWTGDTWKAYYKALKELPYLVYVIDADYGCGIIDTSIPVKKGISEVDLGMLDWGRYLQIGSGMNVKGEIQWE